MTAGHSFPAPSNWQAEGDSVVKSHRSDDRTVKPEVPDKGRTVTGSPVPRVPGADVNRLLTPPEVARQWRIKHDKVLTWIRSGELRAINVATKPSGRPSYRIDPDDLKAFADRRAVVAPPRLPKRQRRRKQPSKSYF